MSQDLASFLSLVPLFRGLETSALERLSSQLDRVTLRGGQVLCHAGEVADCMYVVVSGRLVVTVDVAGSVDTIGEICRGDSLGEMGLLTAGGRRSATVRAARDAELLRLSQAAFAELTEESPEVLLAVTRRIVDLYQSVLASPRAERTARMSTVAIVPVSRGVDLGSLPSVLLEELELPSTLLLTKEVVDGALGAGAADIPFEHARNAELLEYLSSAEVAHDLVVYLADGEPSAWTSRCARQADRALLVVDATADPAPGAVERRLKDDCVDTSALELVLLHPEPRELYPETSARLASRSVREHHHVAAGRRADVARLARLLIGRATGLVLGGGGARAFAQIGVIRALEEGGCAIDRVGGTSMGAFIGAQLASGWTAERIQEYNRECWNEVRPLRDYTFPYVSLVTGQTFLAVTKELYEEAEIEDLPLRFFCCASNLTRAQVRACTSGSLYRWLCASIAVPGVAPPVPFEGDLYVDGAVLDNLPTDVMAERFSGTIVAVDVSPVVELGVDRDLREPPSGWSLARRRVSPFSAEPQLPTIFEVMGRVTALASIRQREEMRSLADFYLHPPIEGVSMFDWDRIDELATLGYEYAKPLVERFMAGELEEERSVLI